MRILIVATRAPWPPRRGHQVRTLQVAEALAARFGRDAVELVAPAPREAARVPEDLPFRFTRTPASASRAALGACAALARGDAAECGLYATAALRSVVAAHAASADLVWLELARLAPVARGLPPAVSLAVDFVDCLSANLERRAALDRPWLRPILALEARRMGRAERELLSRARIAFVVSGRDRAELLARHGAEFAPRLALLPLVVEPCPEARIRERGAPSPVAVVTGNLGYFPTAHGLTRFLEDAWPALRCARPGLELVVAGERCSRRLASALARAKARLVSSPEDLGAVLASAGVALAPLSGGSGVPVKILEAWAAGVPVVASPAAAQAADARDGLELLVASTPEDWVREVAAALDDAALRERLRTGGVARLDSAHSRGAFAAALEELAGLTVESATGSA